MRGKADAPVSQGTPVAKGISCGFQEGISLYFAVTLFLRNTGFQPVRPTAFPAVDSGGFQPFESACTARSMEEGDQAPLGNPLCSDLQASPLLFTRQYSKVAL